MTVGITGQKFSYAGNGGTTTFAFPRPFLNTGDLRVVLVDSGGAETVRSLGPDYNVTTGLGAISTAWAVSTAYTFDDVVSNAGSFYVATSAHTAAASTEPGVGASWASVWDLEPVENGGEVEMTTAPAVGETLIITRRTGLKQETDYQTGGVFSAEGHEDALDKLILIAQDLQEQIDRAIKLKEGTISAAPDFPEPSSGKLIGWDGATLINTAASAVGANGITNVELADMGQATLKGRASGAGTGDPQDLTAAQARTILNVEDGSTADQTAGEIEAIVSHDNLVGFVGDEHIDWTSTSANFSTTGSLACGALTSNGINDDATAIRLFISDTLVTLGATGVAMTLRNIATDQALTIAGGSTGNSGGNIILYGQSHGSVANDFILRGATTSVLHWDHSAAKLNLGGDVDGGGFDFTDVNAITIEPSTGDALLNLDAVEASKWAAVDCYDQGIRRWRIGKDSATDDFALLLYNSSGAFQDTISRVDQSTGDTLIANTLTLPEQPAFSATNSATDTAVTGDNTTVTVEFDTEIFDQNGDFNNTTDTFTAPVSGNYLLEASVRIGNITIADADTIQVAIITSNRSYAAVISNTNDVELQRNVSVSAIADMDASDTATVQAVVFGTTISANIIGGNNVTRFHGFLLG